MSYRVLIVEDDEIICNRIEKILKTESSLEIDVASGKTAYLVCEDLLDMHLYDFAVVDLNLQSLSGRDNKTKGFEIADKIQDKNPKCFIILYSGLLDFVDQETFMGVSKLFIKNGCCIKKLPRNESKILEEIKSRIFFLEQIKDDNSTAKIGNLIYQKRNNKIFSIRTCDTRDLSDRPKLRKIWEYLLEHRGEWSSIDTISYYAGNGDESNNAITQSIKRLNALLTELQGGPTIGEGTYIEKDVYIINNKGIGYMLNE